MGTIGVDDLVLWKLSGANYPLADLACLKYRKPFRSLGYGLGGYKRILCYVFMNCLYNLSVALIDRSLRLGRGAKVREGKGEVERMRGGLAMEGLAVGEDNHGWEGSDN
ncbi:hypothetical protein VNO78_25700 [Psophocarpus tetragonolobus]|uniref:Uncharacterized protein n=1 Tax=Psophocarpus tetragonolobus TaxID=3891 RepID=A0AAN9S7V5_PSOTE